MPAHLRFEEFGPERLCCRWVYEQSFSKTGTANGKLNLEPLKRICIEIKSRGNIKRMETSNDKAELKLAK